jgi:hypothetical protein
LNAAEAALWAELLATDATLSRLRQELSRRVDRRRYRRGLEAAIRDICAHRAVVLDRLRAAIQDEIAAGEPVA